MKRTLCICTLMCVAAPRVLAPKDQITIKNAVRSRGGERHGCNSTQLSYERLHFIKQVSNLQKNEK